MGSGVLHRVWPLAKELGHRTAVFIIRGGDPPLIKSHRDKVRAVRCSPYRGLARRRELSVAYVAFFNVLQLRRGF